MDIQNIKQTVEIIPLLGYELKPAGAYHVGACPFCGGTDRLTVKHTPTGDRWHCRQCGDGKYHTVIDFVMKRDNCDFKTALSTLGGDVSKPITPKAQPRPKPKPITLPDSAWQEKALKHITAAADRLDSDDGKAGHEYLTRRGLSRGTWYAWLLGYVVMFDPKIKRQRPALVIPWLDMDTTGETIIAVKYRFMDDEPDGLRYSAMSGSVPLLFGLQDANKSHDTLLLVEGEFNTLSIWQCHPCSVTALSFGSESGGRVDILQAIALRYQHVFVWADDVWSKGGQRAKDLSGLVKGRGKQIQSVRENNVKHDANQLLQVGALADFLTAILGVECLEN